jgi:glyoxylase-like metal-dependent hydrolase (beta-lactamase superfamily II)
MGDGDSAHWIQTLEAAKKLGAKTICPGHGPMGGAEVLENQIAFFVELRKEVKKWAGKKPEEVKAAVDQIKENLRKQERIAQYIGTFFAAQVEKVYVEMGGKPFQTASAALDEQKRHADAHGREHVHGVAAKAHSHRPSK